MRVSNHRLCFFLLRSNGRFECFQRPRDFLVQRMKEGGGVSFAIDVQQGDEEIFATSLETRDNEEGEDEESNDEVDEGEWV